MPVRGLPEHGGDVDVLAVTVQHVVGEEQDPVAGLQRDPLQRERGARVDAEEEVDVQRYLGHPAGTHEDRQRVPGVDGGGHPRLRVDAHRLPGGELAQRRVRGQRVVRGSHLLGQVGGRVAGRCAGC